MLTAILLILSLMAMMLFAFLPMLAVIVSEEENRKKHRYSAWIE